MDELMEAIKTALRADATLTALVPSGSIKLGYGAEAAETPALRYWPVSEPVLDDAGIWLNQRVQIDIVAATHTLVLQIASRLRDTIARGGWALSVDSHTTFGVSDFAYTGPGGPIAQDETRKQASVDFVVQYRKDS